MTESKIIIRRTPEYGEEPYLIDLEFSASNQDGFSGKIDILCSADDLANMGRSLQTFAHKVPDQYIYEFGDEQRAASYFKMRVYTVHSAGACVIQLAINLNLDEANEAVSRFSLTGIDSTSVNRLGKLLLTFSELNHLELCWIPGGVQQLFEEYQISD